MKLPRIYSCGCDLYAAVEPHKPPLCGSCFKRFRDTTDTLLCAHCDKQCSAHTDEGRCLFAPTVFRPKFGAYFHGPEMERAWDDELKRHETS